MAHRKSRKANCMSRKNRKATRKNTRRNNALRKRRMMYGGQSSPGSVAMNEMRPMMEQSLAQGRQFAAYHANQHGGQNNVPPPPSSNPPAQVGTMTTPPPTVPLPTAMQVQAPASATTATSQRGGKSRRNRRGAKRGGALDGAPFPGAVEAPYILPEALRASARMLPLDRDYTAIANLRDQDGGRRKNRKGSRKSKKNTRKGRKASRKANRKTSRKGSRKNVRRAKRGGSYDLAMASPYGAPTMLLSASQEAKALGGMNAEWKLAENPMAFAPGYSKE